MQEKFRYKFIYYTIAVLLLVMSILCIIPVILVLSTSLSTEESIRSFGYTIIPKTITFYAYRYIFYQAESLLNAYMVTIFITVVGTLLSILIAVLLAYPLSRKSFILKNVLTFYVFFTMLFNGGIVTTYIMMTQILHLKDNIFSLILPLLISPFNIILLRNFFATINEAVIESARIDGASEIRTLFKIVIPISLPGIATVGLFTILSYWNSWFEALLYIDSDNKITLQYFLQRIIQTIEYINNSTNPQVKALEFPKESARMAMCILAIGPIIFVYPFIQKYFIKGLTVGSIK